MWYISDVPLKEMYICVLGPSCRWKGRIRKGYWLQSTPSMSNSKVSTKCWKVFSIELIHKGVTQRKCFNFLGYLLCVIVT